MNPAQPGSKFAPDGIVDRRRAYFDEAFYQKKYQPARDCFEHYINAGWKDGNMPNPFFDPAIYGEVHNLNGQEALAHLVAQSDRTSFCSPAFDRAGYCERNPDVAAAGVEPLLHFLANGLTEKRLPGFDLGEFAARKSLFPHFDWSGFEVIFTAPQGGHLGPANEVYRLLIDSDYYRERYKERLQGCEPVTHYVTRGWREGVWPNRFFDPEWYASHHCLDDTQDPLSHHVLTGACPAPFFCAKSYLRANPEAAYERSPFAHMVRAAAKGEIRLGLDHAQVAALRAVHQSYNWNSADQAGILPEATSAVQSPRATDSGALPPPQREADPLMMATFRQRAERAKLLTFDVWDTLLRRSCHPDELKLYAANVLLGELRASARSAGLRAADLFRLRQLAEFRVADKDYEYSYADMMREWLRLAGVPVGPELIRLTALVTEAEINREIAVTRPDPTGLAMLSHPSDTPKIAISDFYLPGEALSRILDHHGLLRYFRQVHVSCDVMLTKRGGSLFDHVLALEQIAPGDVLHIGDNPHADVAVPMARGLNTLLFTDAIEDRRKSVFQARFDAQLANDGTTVLTGLLRRAGTGRAGTADATSSKARRDALKGGSAVPAQIASVKASSIELLALTFAGFGLFILERARAAGAKTIFFATREGDFFKRVCELLIEHNLLGAISYPVLRLLEVSRRATFAASLREVSTRELMRLWSLYSTQSMRALACTLNLDEARMARFCTVHGIDPEEQIECPWEDQRVVALLDDPGLRDWLAQAILEQRGELLTYLEQVGFAPNERIDRFFVDIGWRGSIQDNLAFLCQGQIEGAYLALYPYVAEQPINAAKHGYLVDHNLGRSGFHVGDFAALEFVANGPGGSVTGYTQGCPRREALDEEEAYLAEQVLPLQDRILATIQDLASTLRSIPLGEDSWAAIGRHAVTVYASRPDAHIADMFERLTHNETFGVGEVLDMALDNDAVLALNGAELHSAVTDLLSRQRWPEAWCQSTQTRANLDGLSLDRRLALPRTNGLCAAPALVRSLGQQISIFAPQPIVGSGGHRTIYNFAKALDRAGYAVNLFSEARGEFAYKEQEMAGSTVRLHDAWYSGIIPDAAVATISHSAKYLNDYFSQDTRRFYFVQDFEAAFNPVSDGYVRGENSFALGHNHICIGNWLPHVIRTQFGQGAAGGGLGVDTDVYRIDREANRARRIAVLYQPEKWRRLPEMCIEALTLVKARQPDVEIVFYGSAERPQTPWPSVHLGLVNELDALNNLYNSSELGLCISLTNPSRVPFEMMAAGCVPVDVYRYNNLFDYANGTGLLAYQSAHSLAAAMLHLLDNPAERQARSELGAKIAAQRTLDWEVDVAVNTVEQVLAGKDLATMPVPERAYTATAFLGSADQTPPVQAWCNWQARLAGGG